MDCQALIVNYPTDPVRLKFILSKINNMHRSLPIGIYHHDELFLGENMFIKSETAKEVIMAKGVRRKVLSHGGSLMAVEVSFDKGSIGAMHTHINEQVCYTN